MTGNPVGPPSSDPLTRLLDVIPKKASRSGLGRLKAILAEALPGCCLTAPQLEGRLELGEAEWNRLWQTVLAHYASYDTRRRMRELLMDVARAWQGAGLISTLPAFDVPPQHRRRAALAVDRLRAYRFDDYQRLVDWLVDSLSGKGDPPSLGLPALGQPLTGGVSEQLLWLTLMLILSGVAQHGPLKVISQLGWEDVLLTLPLEPTTGPGLVMRLPRRNGQAYTWLRLPKLTALFVYALAHPARTLKGPLGKTDALTWARSFRQFLARLCGLAGVPPIGLTQLIYFVRLDLRQELPNPNLAVLLGQQPFSPVPADQMLALTHAVAGAVPAARHWRPGLAAAGTEEEMEEALGLDGWDPEILSRYDSLFEGKSGLRNRIMKMLGEPSAGTIHEVRQDCDKLLAADDGLVVDVARFNLGWVGRWLVSLGEDRGLRTSTRKTYLASVCRVIRLCPEMPAPQIGQARLQALLSTFRRPTAKLTCSAWKRFGEFLKSSGLEVTPIEWGELVFGVDASPRRVLTDSDGAKIYASLSGPRQQVFWFNQKTGLRVSEACRLLVGDVILGEEPHLLITNSKGGRSRRVSLGHLSPTALQHLNQHLQKRRVAGPDAPFIADPSGRALDPKSVSGEVGRQLIQAGLATDQLEGLAPSLHSARKRNAEERYRQTGDLRHVSHQLGHALPLTTIGWYLHLLDLDTVRRLEAWPSPLNRPGLHLPLVTLAGMLAVDRSRIRQIVSEFNVAHPGQSIQAVRPTPDLPDGAGRCGRALRADYLSVEDAFRLLQWLVRKRSKSPLLPTP